MSEHLASWHDTATREAIVDFVDRVTTEGGPDYVPPAERVAVFDNDGTLWCEKPMPIELGFILMRLAEMAETDESLRGRQPWQAAYEKDYGWLGEAITKHYHGDDADVKLLHGRHPPGLRRADASRSTRPPPTRSCAAESIRRSAGASASAATCPMIELLRYLEANGFTNYIASGGDRDFMRPVTGDIYGIPSERVIGSSNALVYADDEHGGSVSYAGDDGCLRRRPGEAGADLEPDRAAPDPRRRQFERRHPDAPLRRREGSPGAPAAPAPRRRRARVRVHGGGRDVARAGRGARMDGRQRQERLGDRLRRCSNRHRARTARSAARRRPSRARPRSSRSAGRRGGGAAPARR